MEVIVPSLQELAAGNNNFQKIRKYKLLNKTKELTLFLDCVYNQVEWAQRFWRMKLKNAYVVNQNIRVVQNIMNQKSICIFKSKSVVNYRFNSKN